MFPIPLEIISERRIDNEQDRSYKALLSQELKYCINNQDTIRKLAKRTYERLLLGKNPSLIKNSCNFLLLEQKCQEYIQAHQQEQPHIIPNQISSTQDFVGFIQGK